MAKILKLRGENLIGVRAKPKEIVFPVTSADQVIVDAAVEKSLATALTEVNQAIGQNAGKITVLEGKADKLAPTPTSETGSSVAFTQADPVPEGVTLVYGELSSISFAAGSFPNSPYETTIYFTSGATKTTLILPSGTKVIGDIDIEANTDYIIVIRDGNFVMAPINTWTA